MTTLSSGASVAITLTYDAVINITIPDAVSRVLYSVRTAAGALRISSSVHLSGPIGKFETGDIVTLTAERSAIDYTVSEYITYGDARLRIDGNDNVTGFVSVDGTSIVTLASLRQSDGYHFHGFAPNQINSDLKFYDYSGALNDGAFQAQLTAANAWATAGFLTQADPSGAGNLMLTSLPALTFNYLAGDSLLIFWRGMATPEGGDSPIMGNTGGTAANGIRVIVTSAGKLKINAYQASGALSRFGGTSTATVFEAATAHSFALAIDGVTGKHCYWADGVRDAGYSSGFIAFGSGGIIDTASSTTLKLGGDGSTSSSVQLGVACKTQALVILEGRNGLGTPVVADLDLLVANLHRNPQKLILASAW